MEHLGESAPPHPPVGGPSRTQRRAGRPRRVSGLARPALARPPPPPTSAPWEKSERLPYQEQEAEDAPADHQLGRRRRHLRFRSRQAQRGGEGRDGDERDPEPRSLKVKGAEGRSGGLPRRPDPRASPGDRPSGGGASSARRDVTTSRRSLLVVCWVSTLWSWGAK